MPDASKKLRGYLFTYECDGVPYNLHVSAYSQAEALARVRRMSTATYGGEVVAKIPIPLAWLARLARAIEGRFHA